MTAKNRIILSICAIFTTLVVAGSMVFIIFAATRGSVSGGLSVTFSQSGLFYGTVETHYTTSPISSFNTGDEGTVIKTTQGANYLDFRGWQYEQDVADGKMTLETLDIDLTPENPWLILGFYIAHRTPTHWVHMACSLASGSDYDDNIDILFYGYPSVSEVSPQGLASGTHVELQYNIAVDGGMLATYSGSPIDLKSHAITDLWNADYRWIYILFKVKDPTQSAFFRGGIQATLWGDV